MRMLFRCSFNFHSVINTGHLIGLHHPHGCIGSHGPGDIVIGQYAGRRYRFERQDLDRTCDSMVISDSE